VEMIAAARGPRQGNKMPLPRVFRQRRG
jgi:hypothetical protein